MLSNRPTNLPRRQSNSTNSSSVTDDDSDPEYGIEIPVASLYNPEDRQKLLELKKEFPKAKFLIYAPDAKIMDKRFDGSLLLILAMAVGTVLAGSLWSGYAKHHL